MWRFVEGAKPPKRPSEDKKERDQAYEKKRKRSFLPQWKVNRPWLRVEASAQGDVMFCDYCINANVASDKTSFVRGCHSLRVESITYHEESNCHGFAVRKHVNEQQPEAAPALKAQISLNKQAMDRLTLLFRTVHAINIQARPSLDYCWITELDEVKGLNVGTQYRNIPKCQEFASAIAEVQQLEMQNHLKQCKFAAVIVDGSTDSSSIENEMVYIQTCLNGSTKTNFVRCCQIQRGNAIGIVEAIKKSVETLLPWSDFVEKLVALGSDGASVMLGKHNGVIALLQSEQPSVIAVHCSGHRLELAFKDSLKKFPLAEKISTLLSGLYYMYRNSPLNRTNLKQAYHCLNMKVLLPTRVSGSRWVGHMLRALNNFMTGYPAFRLHLEQLAASKERSDSKSKAVGFLKLIRSRSIIMMGLFMQDILTTLHKVSLKFQEEGSVVSDVSVCIKTAMARLQSLATTDGPFMQKIKDFETCAAPSAGSVTRNTFKLTGGDHDFLKQDERAKFIDTLCDALRIRFEDTQPEIIQATSIANFKVWPVEESQLEGFGDNEINTLVEQFKCFLPDVDQVKAEWPLLRTSVFEVFSKKIESLTWQQLHRRFQAEYSAVLELFDLVQTIPATSTACERGFSHMKLIKSDRRTRVTEETLTNCLMIKLEGQSIQNFDPIPAIELWLSKANRRLVGGSKASKEKGAVTSTLITEGEKDEAVEHEARVPAPVPMQDAAAAFAVPMYQLLEHAESIDSDYGSDCESSNEEEEEVFNKLAAY